MMNEKVYKVMLGRLEEAAVYYQMHKNEVWENQLAKTKDSLIREFVEQEKEIKSLTNKLRRIDSDIRSTEDPIPFIISTLKETLPEYK